MFRYDLKRIAANQSKLKKIQSFFISPELQYIYLYRKYNATNNFILKIILIVFYRIYSYIFGFQISLKTKIGKGLNINHRGSIVINPNAELGNNINLHPGINIGQENRGERKGAPKIGSEVWIGTNVCIVGKITIGNNVLIASNSFVNFDIPSDSVVLGNPGRIIPNKKATKDYIINRV
ncbi:hypothetical protein VSU16_12380 (plasmid) [Cetobacterium somerae]|uniref:serine O-acetyltransferase n=1 Tax=Cetobacterium somerae TaxID=188913 RepID=UPI002E7B8E2E|nr:hypothetical protein [Cetobacterium somerae]WVJ02312.1 hypothetical protein VSU16_12380 [Cetobacterium somerae]